MTLSDTLGQLLNGRVFAGLTYGPIRPCYYGQVA